MRYFTLNEVLALHGQVMAQSGGAADGLNLPALNQTTGDSYTTVTSCAASTQRSSVGLIVRSLVNQALRGLESPLFAEPGA